VAFLNKLVEEFLKIDAFAPSQHMSAMATRAIGSLFQTLSDAGRKPTDFVQDIAEVVVGLGAIGRDKNEEIYEMILNGMKERYPDWDGEDEDEEEEETEE